MLVAVGGKITIAAPEGGDMGMSRIVGAEVGIGAFVVVKADAPEMVGGGTTIGPEP